MMNKAESFFYDENDAKKKKVTKASGETVEQWTTIYLRILLEQ